MYHKIRSKVTLVILALVTSLISVITISAPITYAGIQLQTRSDTMSNSGAGQISTHLFSFTPTNTSTPVGSITFQFCDNSPLIGDVCNPPNGLDISNAQFTLQTGNTGFSLQSIVGDTITLTRNPVVMNGILSTYKFDNITNPTSAGEYFTRMQTFSSTDGSGPYVEQGGDAIAITNQFIVNSIVPPYLTFCGGVTISAFNCGSVSGDLINFGQLLDNSTSTGSSQFMIATNAQNGYSVFVGGYPLTSGNYNVNSLSSPTPSRVGQSQFGINMVANTSPQVGQNVSLSGLGNPAPTANYGLQNLFTYNQGDAVVSAPGPTDYSKFTASYLVNVNSAQQPGVYATTIYYICLANF